MSCAPVTSCERQVWSYQIPSASHKSELFWHNLETTRGRYKFVEGYGTRDITGWRCLAMSNSSKRKRRLTFFGIKYANFSGYTPIHSEAARRSAGGKLLQSSPFLNSFWIAWTAKMRDINIHKIERELRPGSEMAKENICRQFSQRTPQLAAVEVVSWIFPIPNWAAV